MPIIKCSKLQQITPPLADTPVLQASPLDGWCWLIVRLFVAVVLLAAAFMKAQQLATVPSLGEGLLHARWFNIFVVEFELFFAIWLIFGLLPKTTWLATIGCFSVFAAVSFYKLFSKELSCGCFGAVPIPPAVTASFDIGVIILLSFFRPFKISASLKDLISEGQNFAYRWKTLLYMVLTWAVIALPTTGMIMSLDTMSLAQHQGDPAGKSITLEPMNWIGKPFPLTDFLDTKEWPPGWGQGTWTILLYHRDCTVCHALLNELAAKVDTLPLTRIAFIEIPDEEPASLPPPLQEQAGLTCSLRPSSKWFSPSPVAITIENNVVTNVRIGVEARKMFL